MYTEIINKMKLKGIKFEEGLTNEEIEKIEDKYGIKFPKSLTDFYKEEFPIGDAFPNWRNLSNENVTRIKERILRPYNDLIEDIKDNQFWSKDWPNLDNVNEKVEYFNDLYSQSPQLIPIAYSRYIIISEEADNPAVLSVHGSDIIVYGNNLKEYLENEFLLDHNSKNKCEFLPHMGKWIEIMDAY